MFILQLKNPAQGVSVLRQVACALAVGEVVMQFEHRDLHVGNVLVQPTDSASITVVLNNTPITIDSEGVHVSIIDFTLSRLSKGMSMNFYYMYIYSCVYT